MCWKLKCAAKLRYLVLSHRIIMIGRKCINLIKITALSTDHRTAAIRVDIIIHIVGITNSLNIVTRVDLLMSIPSISFHSHIIGSFSLRLRFHWSELIRSTSRILHFISEILILKERDLLTHRRGRSHKLLLLLLHLLSSDRRLTRTILIIHFLLITLNTIIVLRSYRIIKVRTFL